MQVRAEQCGLMSCTCPGEASDGAADPAWAFGIFLAVCACLSTTVGFLLQKTAHNRQRELIASGETSYSTFNGILCSPLWLTGWLLQLLVAFPLDFLALAFAPQSVIAPLSGLTIIASQVIGPMALGERKPTYLEWWASTTIIAGMVLLATAGQQCATEYTLDGLERRFLEPQFWINQLLQGCFMVYAALLPCLPVTHEHPFLAPVAYAFVAGVLGGQQSLMFKVMGNIIREITEENNVSLATDATVWVLACSTILVAFCQVMFMNKGLAKMEVTRYLPMYDAFLIICSSTSGMVFFKEYARLTAFGVTAYCIAISVVVGGVVTLGLHNRGSAPTNGEKQDAKDGPEEEQLTGPSESSALMGSAAADRRAPANRSVSTS